MDNAQNNGTAKGGSKMESKHPDGGNAKTRSIGGYDFPLNAGTAYTAKVNIHGQDSNSSVRIYTVKKIWEPSPTMYNPPRQRLVAEVPNLHIRKAVELANEFNQSTNKVW